MSTRRTAQHPKSRATRPAAPAINAAPGIAEPDLRARRAWTAAAFAAVPAGGLVLLVAPRATHGGIALVTVVMQTVALRRRIDRSRNPSPGFVRCRLETSSLIGWEARRFFQRRDSERAVDWDRHRWHTTSHVAVSAVLAATAVMGFHAGFLAAFGLSPTVVEPKWDRVLLGSALGGVAAWTARRYAAHWWPPLRRIHRWVLRTGLLVAAAGLTVSTIATGNQWGSQVATTGGTLTGPAALVSSALGAPTPRAVRIELVSEADLARAEAELQAAGADAVVMAEALDIALSTTEARSHLGNDLVLVTTGRPGEQFVFYDRSLEDWFSVRYESLLLVAETQ